MQVGSISGNYENKTQCQNPSLTSLNSTIDKPLFERRKKIKEKIKKQVRERMEHIFSNSGTHDQVVYFERSHYLAAKNQSQLLLREKIATSTQNSKKLGIIEKAILFRKIPLNHKCKSESRAIRKLQKQSLRQETNCPQEQISGIFKREAHSTESILKRHSLLGRNFDKPSPIFRVSQSRSSSAKKCHRFTSKDIYKNTFAPPSPTPEALEPWLQQQDDDIYNKFLMKLRAFE